MSHRQIGRTPRLYRKGEPHYFRLHVINACGFRVKGENPSCLNLCNPFGQCALG